MKGLRMVLAVVEQVQQIGFFQLQIHQGEGQRRAVAPGGGFDHFAERPAVLEDRLRIGLFSQNKIGPDGHAETRSGQAKIEISFHERDSASELENRHFSPNAGKRAIVN